MRAVPLYRRSVKNAHCSYCGVKFADVPFPRTCAGCGKTTWVNPLPVAVMVLPVDDGVLCVRRGIEPHRGKLALPGGFVNLGESWQHGCARELFEETGIRVDATQVKHLNVISAPDSTILIFGEGPRLAAKELPPFAATDETTERVVVTEPVRLAFPIHEQVLRDWFKVRRHGPA